MPGPRPVEEAALDHLDALYRFARRLAPTPEDAEDLVQETYVKALRAAHTFTPVGDATDASAASASLRSWLFKILHTTFLNEYRRAQRTPATESFDTLEALDATGEYYLYNHLLAEHGGAVLPQSAEEEVLGRLGVEDVRTALAALPELYRVAVTLCDVEGLAYREIAAALDVPMGTVMSRLSRGRKQLQRILWEQSAASRDAAGEPRGLKEPRA
jgi:RNA polymerase sigma-70 factor (ECF subfamily)